MASERLVVDSGFLLEAVLPTSTQWRLEALDLIERIALRDVEASVPWLFFAEVSAVVTRKGVRSRKLSSDEGEAFLAQIDSLGMYVDLTLEQSLSIHQKAMLWGTGLYDAYYVDLAIRMAIPVATRDKSMAAAGRTFGAGAYEP